jgi:TrmH family RNA methyltransferase
MESTITSKQNNLIKYVRGLREKRFREQEGLFVIEGAKFVKEAIDSGIKPDKVVFSHRIEKNPVIGETLSQLDGTVQTVEVTDEVMDYMCETDTPQGIIALVKMSEVNLDDICVSKIRFLVVIDSIQDPGNVGTIIRTADAFGASAVILSKGSADLYNPKTLRATMGSVFHLPVIRDVDTMQVKNFLANNKVYTVVSSLADGALPLNQAKMPVPAALVLGNEVRGVSPELGADADLLLKIPMAGQAESLNVAIAAGILLYEAFYHCGSNSNETCK